MEYHGAVYLLLFLPFTLMAYQLTPQKKRWITLLLAGYVFFWSISGKLVLYLVGTSLFTHYIGIWLARTKEQYAKIKKELPKEQIAEVKKKYKNLEKKILAFGIVGLLCVLLSLKYLFFSAKYQYGSRAYRLWEYFAAEKDIDSHRHLFLHAAGHQLHG